MSEESNNQGRAYEYICLLTLHKEINEFRNAEIEQNSAYNAAHHAWTQVGKVFRIYCLKARKRLPRQFSIWSL